MHAALRSTQILQDFKKGQKVNIQYWPYWQRGGICISDYDIIVKLETFNEDNLYIKNALGLQVFEETHSYN